MLVSKENKRGYRNNFVTTLLFSGVQIYQIIIRIVRSKFVAMFIGPEGMGITSLLNSTTDLISASTNLGLSTSSVKTIAEAHSSSDEKQIGIIVTVLRRLVLLTGLFGMLICVFFAPIWSNQSFGNSDYTWAFIVVSVIILAEQLNKGELALLQGLQQKKYLARANIIGQTIGLIVTVPLYYFFGLKAIVWVLVYSSILAYCISKYFTHKVSIKVESVSWRETFSIGREMIKLGIFLSLQFILSQAVLYFVRNYISQTGGVEDVGLYSAGTAIVNTYLGLVFTAMATGYFPLLAATKSNIELKDSVMKQAEISILLLAPIVLLFILFIKPVILLLYSNKFLPIENMLYWAMGATLLKGMGWALSYTILAKAKPVYFFYNELFAKFYTFPITILGYKYYGLTGFGVAILIGYSIYLVQEIIVVRHLFKIMYDKNIWILFICLNISIILVYCSKLLLDSFWGYIVGIIISVISTIYVLNELNKRLDLKSAIKKYTRKH